MTPTVLWPHFTPVVKLFIAFVVLVFETYVTVPLFHELRGPLFLPEISLTRAN